MQTKRDKQLGALGRRIANAVSYRSWAEDHEERMRRNPALAEHYAPVRDSMRDGYRKAMRDIVNLERKLGDEATRMRVEAGLPETEAWEVRP